jgi:hypothetical protein
VSHSVTVRIAWPEPSLWQNARLNVFTKAKAVKRAKEMAWIEALAAGIKRLPRCEGYTICCTFTPPKGSRHDRMNMRDACKAYFDGIALALGVNDRTFTPGTDCFNLPDGEGRVEIEVTVTDAWQHIADAARGMVIGSIK